MLGITGALNLLDLPRSMIADVATLNNPLDQLADPFGTSGRQYGTDVLRKYGLLSDREGLGNTIAGLGADILLDPLTWGVGGLAMRGGSSALRAAARRTPQAVREALASAKSSAASLFRKKAATVADEAITPVPVSVADSAMPPVVPPTTADVPVPEVAAATVAKPVKRGGKGGRKSGAQILKEAAVQNQTDILQQLRDGKIDTAQASAAIERLQPPVQPDVPRLMPPKPPVTESVVPSTPPTAPVPVVPAIVESAQSVPLVAPSADIANLFGIEMVPGSTGVLDDAAAKAVQNVLSSSTNAEFEAKRALNAQRAAEQQAKINELLGVPKNANSTKKIYETSVAKQPWEMTRDEYVESLLDSAANDPKNPQYKVMKSWSTKPGGFKTWQDSLRNNLSNEWHDLRDKAIAEGKYVKERPSWMMTQKEEMDLIGNGPEEHRIDVENAIKLGKDVPREVLADYPDLIVVPVSGGELIKKAAKGKRSKSKPVDLNSIVESLQQPPAAIAESVERGENLLKRKAAAESVAPVAGDLPFDMETAYTAMQKRGYADYGDFTVKPVPHPGGGYGVEVRESIPKTATAYRDMLPTQYGTLEEAQNAALNELKSRVTGERPSAVVQKPDLTPPSLIDRGFDEPLLQNVESQITDLRQVASNIEKAIKEKKGRAGQKLKNELVSANQRIAEKEAQRFEIKKYLHASQATNPIEKFVATARLDREERAAAKMAGGLSEKSVWEQIQPYLEDEIAHRYPDASPELRKEILNTAGPRLLQSPMMGIDRHLEDAGHAATLGVSRREARKAVSGVQGLQTAQVNNFHKQIDEAYDPEKIAKLVSAASDEGARNVATELKAKQMAAEAAAESKRLVDLEKSARAGKMPLDVPQSDMRKLAMKAFGGHREWHTDFELPKGMDEKAMVSSIGKQVANHSAVKELYEKYGVFTDGKMAVKLPGVGESLPAVSEDRSVRIINDLESDMNKAVSKEIHPYAMQRGHTVTNTDKSESISDLVVLRSQAGKDAAVAQARYVATYKSLYPDATFHVSKSGEEVIVKSGGKPVGMMKIVDSDIPKAAAEKLSISSIAEPGVYGPDDIEFTSNRAYTKDGAVSIPIEKDSVAGIPVATLPQAKKLAAEILSYAHGMDDEGNLIFKPKGSAKKEITKQDLDDLEKILSKSKATKKGKK